VEDLGHVGPPSRREKIEYPSRIEKIDEEDKIQKMYSNQSINQVDRESISYSNPIHPSFTISQTIIGLFEYQSQQGRLVITTSVPSSMGSNFSGSKTKNKDKPKKRNAEIITRRERSSNSIREGQVIFPDRFKEYEVELYRQNKSNRNSQII
jgi:hypothetical protein